MYEKILVPLDGSKAGEAALPAVEELVTMLLPQRRQKVEVTLFQVVSSLSHYVVAGEASARIPYTEEELEIIKQKARDYLEKVSKSLSSSGTVVKTKVSVNKNAADEINKAVDEIGADLVAMSTHGRSGLSRWAFGSVTEKVLRGGKIPVLMVRMPKEPAA